jgi:hypothetical protein
MIVLLAFGFFLGISAAVVAGASLFGQAMLPPAARYTGTINEFITRRALSRIDLEERFWNFAASQAPELKLLVEKYCSTLNRLKRTVPAIASEASEFIDRINDARFDDELEELDSELVRREKNFAIDLLNAWRESGWLILGERLSGKISDVKSALTTESVHRYSREIRQEVGTAGFLIEPPKVIAHEKISEVISDALAAGWSRSFGRLRRHITRALAVTGTRYAWQWARRNFFPILITVGVLGLGTEYVIQSGDLPLWGAAGWLVIASAVAAKLFEKFSKKTWLEMHRRAVRRSTYDLYMSFIDFAIKRAPLNAAHDHWDGKMFPRAPSDEE